MKNATLRQLRVFSAVARHLSFVRAAEELKLTAPAVSMQIKELETEVGLPLFDRSSRKVSLTMVGEYVLAYAQRVLAAMRDAEDMVARFRGLKTGVLDVAMVSTAKYFLPRLLARFRDEHPGVEVRLRVASNREEVVALMREGAVELAIMGRPPKNWPSRAEPFAIRARRVHGGVSDDPAGGHADVEQRSHQAGRHGRNGGRAAVAAHRRP